jgi:lysyl-tRNA synthetase class 1
LDRLADYALNYYEDFVKPNKQFRAPSENEAAALNELRNRLLEIDPETKDAELLQTLVFEIGNAFGFDPLRLWFQALYEILLGQSQGPRFGTFMALFGVDRTIELIDKAVSQ